MSIKIDALHKGLIGDFVPSILGSKGATHFVTPKFNRTGMADYEALWNAAALALLPTGRQPDLAKPSELFAHSVILKADSSSGFAASYKWQGAKPLAGSPHMAEVSRLKAGHFPVRIKEKRSGRVVAQLNVWVVESVISATELPDRIKDSARVGLVQMGYAFLHDIRPASIITARDIPDLKGASRALLPNGTNYAEKKLQLGAEKMWDTSRIVRQKVLNPKKVDLRVPGQIIPDSPENLFRYGNFHNYPTMADRDGHSGEPISFREWLIVGNDDVDTSPDDDNPYDTKWPTGRVATLDGTRAGLPLGGGTSPRGKLRSFDLCATPRQ